MSRTTIRERAGKRRTRKKRAATMLAIAAATSAQIAFFGGGIGRASGATADQSCPAGRASDADTELTEVRVATLPVVDFAPVYYAASCGYFAAAGLDVSLETVQGGVIGVQLMTAGGVDFTVVNWFGFAQAVSNGAPLMGVANATVATPDTNYIYVAADSDIEAAGDLVGATLGTNTMASVGEVSATSVLQSMDIEGDPQWVATPLPETLPAIQSGALDGGHLAEPFVTAADAAGLRPVIDIFDGPMAGLPLAGYATLAATVTEQPELATAFRTGIEEATAALAADDEALRAFVVTYATLPPELAPQITLPDFAAGFDAAEVQQTVDVMFDTGFLPDRVDVMPNLATVG